MDAPTIQHSTLNTQHLTFVSSPNPFAYRIPKVSPILPHLGAANLRGFYDAGQRLARVRRDLVPVLHILRPNDEPSLWIEDDDVSVVARGQLPLAIAQSRHAGRA